MRRRRCFADTSLDAATLDCQQAHHALLAAAAAAAATPGRRQLPAGAVPPPPQPKPLLFRLPVLPYQLATSKLAAADESAGLTAQWMRPPTAIISDDLGQPSKSGGFDVHGTLSRLYPASGSSLAFARSTATYPGRPALGRTRTAVAGEDRTPAGVVDRSQDSPSAEPSTGHPRLHAIETRVVDSDEQQRRLGLKSSRKTTSSDFSVESLLAR